MHCSVPPQRDMVDRVEASVVLSGERTFIFHSIRNYYYLLSSTLHDLVPSLLLSQGVVENLQKPVVAFARLRDSVVMEGVLEAPIPVRFVFFLVGPSHSGMDYHECGRAMAALMADWVRRSFGLGTEML